MAKTVNTNTDAQLEMVGAYDNRKRIFDEMRNPNLTDDERAELTQQYAEAAHDFDDKREALIKSTKTKTV